MPYREQEYTERCVQCKGEATCFCKRCGAASCETHAPEKKRRCDDCEAGFLKRTRVERMVLDADSRGEAYTRVRRPFIFAPFAVIGLILGLTYWPMAAPIWVAGIAFTKLSPPTVANAQLLVSVKRNRFLLEEKRSARLLAKKREAHKLSARNTP